jgi:hypothetical protein
MGRGGMAFGNLGAKMAATTLEDKPKEAEKPKEVEPAPEEKKEDGGGGWSWGALAAMEGSIGNINNDIYGEVLTDGCALMMLDLPESARLEEDSVVYDFGSGYGKFTMWVGTVAKHKSIGIENNELRGKSAEYALVMAREKGLIPKEDLEKIEIRTGDALEEDAFWDCTHMFAGNTGFDNWLTTEMLLRIPKCENFRCLMCVTSIHDGEKGVKPEELEAAGLTYVAKRPIPTTWDPEAKVTNIHYYLTKKGMEGKDIPKLKLKLVDAERYAKMVEEVYNEIMKDIPADQI